MKALQTIGKTVTALVGCILMPVLIWVALGTAIYQRGKTQAVPTIGEAVAAGIKG